MKHKNDVFFEVKINTDTFDIITGSMEFYDFLANRLFYKCDLIVEESQRENFRKKVSESQKSDCFPINLLDGKGNLIEMLVCIKNIGNDASVTLQFIELGKIYEKYVEAYSEAESSKAVLSQLGNFYYSYDKEQDKITCAVMKTQYEVILEEYVEEWGNKIDERLGYSVQEVKAFLSDLRSGTRNFKYLIPGKVLFDDVDNEIYIHGSAIYEDGIHVRTVGCISKVKEGYANESIRCDQLTGLILKEDITNIAKKRIDVMKKPTTIAIIDIDDFKDVNDNCGHMKGDEVLRSCADIIANAVKGLGSAGRIGGDEFLIVLDCFPEREGLCNLLKSIINNISAKYSKEKDGFKISASIGCALSPKDVDNFTDLFLLADCMLYRAKDKGKSRYILYTPEKHGPVEDIFNNGIENDNVGISSRKGLSKSEIICKIMDKLVIGEGYAIKSIFNEIVDYFGVERIILYSLDNDEVVLQCGNKVLGKKVIDETKDYILDEHLRKCYNKGVLTINNIKIFEVENSDVYNKLKKQGVYSFMHHEIINKNKERYVVSYEAVMGITTWSGEDMHFFRILDRILAESI